MDEEDAYGWFRQARWRDGVPTCPKCGLVGAHDRPARRFRCKAEQCRAEFSVTSGTILASRKLGFRSLLLAVALSVHSVKGKAACQLKRELGVDYKTAFVLLHKLRECVALLRRDLKLEGTVEMDGAYFGGHQRPKNRKEDRVDGRLAENQTGKREAVITMRERGTRRPDALGFRAEERADVAWHLAENHVDKTAGMRTDGHASYAGLKGLNTHVQNDHSKAYVETRDASTNLAESLFSRLRRAEIGIHHRISGKYLDWYAADVSWREDRRRTGFLEQAQAVLRSALAHPVSRDMAGYWQRKDKRKAPLVAWHPLQDLGLRRAGAA